MQAISPEHHCGLFDGDPALGREKSEPASLMMRSAISGCERMCSLIRARSTGTAPRRSVEAATQRSHFGHVRSAPALDRFGGPRH